MRDAEALGKDRAELAMALVVRLQTGEHQVEGFALHGLGDGDRAGPRIGGAERVVLHVDGTVGAAGEGLANHLLHAGRTG